MNQLVKVLCSISALSTLSYGTVTNYNNNGVTNSDQLSNTNYVGTIGENAATVSAISDLQVINSSFVGGQGLDGDFAGSLTSLSGDGLSLSNLDKAEITGLQAESEKIQGGSGGTISITASGIRAGNANGGNAVRFSGATSAQQLLINDGYLLGGDGGNVLGLSANTLIANGGSAVYADSGMVNARGGLFVGGDGGVVAGAGAGTLSAKGGSGIDVNITTAVINTLDAGVVATGGKGGSADEFTALVSDTAGGNGLNLRWDLGQFGLNTIIVNGGEYTGGAGGVSSGNDAIADGGLGMLMEGGQSIVITEGLFVGGDGGVATGEVARADGGIGAKLWFANTATGASLLISGGTFRGGEAGIANGARGEDGYGLFLTASSSELSDVDVTGRGLLVNAAGLPTETTIKSGTFSGATFTSFVPPEFSAAIPSMNVFTIEDGVFGDIIVEGVAGSDGTMHKGVAADLVIRGEGDNNIKLGSQFALQDLYLGGSAVNYLSISNGVSSSGNVLLSSGVTEVSLWSDSHFQDTTVSNGVINFNNQDFNLGRGSSFALRSQDAEANFERALNVESGGSLNVGLGVVEATDFAAESGSSLFTTYTADGAGVANGLIKGTSLSFESGLKWLLANDGSVTNSAQLVDGFILASATGSITQDLTLDDFEMLGNPDWLYGINGVTSEGNVLHATYGERDIDDVIMTTDPEFAKALQDLSELMTEENTDLIRSWSEDQAVSNLENAYARSPEMASALMGLQSVFADQVKNRVRSNLRMKNFGSKTAYAPMGAAGPSDWYDNSVQWTRDHLPRWDSRGAVRDVADGLPSPDVKADTGSNVGKPYSYGRTDSGYDEVVEQFDRTLSLSQYAEVVENLDRSLSLSQYEELVEKLGDKGLSIPEYDELVDMLNVKTSTVSKEAVEVPSTYQVWGRGYGSQLNQDAVSGFSGYDANIAGGMVGVDKRFENMLIGLGGGYARTMVYGAGGYDGDADTCHATVYYSATKGNAYFDANVNYAFNDVETEFDAFGYDGAFNAHTVGLYLGGGYGMSFAKDKYLFTPEASMLMTYYGRDSYTETSSLGWADKEHDSYDEMSYLSSVGATLSMIGQIEYFNAELQVQPEIRAHWLHEFNDELDDETYMMSGGVNQIAVALQAREEDLLKLGAGVRFSKWGNETTEFGVDVDGAIGSDYDAVIVSGNVVHRF